MANKKAIIITALVAIIIAIIAGMFIMLVFGNVAEASGAGSMVDSMCRFNTGLVASFSSVGRGVLPLIFCPERTVVIDATDWSKCNAELYKKDTVHGRDYCAAQQILTLADRCWYMYGDGKKSISGYVQGWRGGSCFEFKIKNLPKTGQSIITDDTLSRVAYDNVNPRTGQSYRTEFSYTSAQNDGGPMKRIVWPFANQNKETVNNNVYWRMTYIDTNKDFSLGNLAGMVAEAITGKAYPLISMSPA
jgi:hypothetical protein